jgi:hypothetical protein
VQEQIARNRFREEQRGQRSKLPGADSNIRFLTLFSLPSFFPPLVDESEYWGPNEEDEDEGTRDEATGADSLED